MIEVIFTDGEMAGRRVSLSPGGNPQKLLFSLAQIGRQWRVEFTADKIPAALRTDWVLADIAVRIDRAFSEQRNVSVNGNTYRTVMEIVQGMVAIRLPVSSLRITHDNQDGLVLASLP